MNRNASPAVRYVLPVAILVLVSAACNRSGGGGGKDTQSPTISIETPTTAAAYTTNLSQLNLGGTASDDNGVSSVTWSNIDTGASGPAVGTDTWTAQIALVVGSNLITVTATDLVGKAGTDSISVTYDAAPIVTIDTPTTAMTYSTLASPIALAGTATDLSGVVMVNWSNLGTGGSGTATGTTSWSASIPLATGSNAITVSATDTLGNMGTDLITVTLAAGEAWSWGGNIYGQIGDGTSPIHTMPVLVLDPGDPTGLLTTVAAIAGGESFSVASLADGTVRTWGANGSGQLGDAAFGDQSTPVQVVDPVDLTGFLTGVDGVAAGFAHGVARRTDGTVRTWGGNWEGQLGDGTRISGRTAVRVVDLTDPTGYLTNVMAVASGAYHVVALMADGTLRSWGDNFYGQLGDGSTTDSQTPVQVIDLLDPTGFLTGVMAVSAGDRHSMALLTDGTVRSWGDNSSGQLGDGTNLDSAFPVQVIDPIDPFGYIRRVESIAAGGRHSAAIILGGTGKAWGDNTYGQLGDGTTMSRPALDWIVDVTDPGGFLINAVSIAAGRSHTVVRKSDETLRSWGRNTYGQLGAGTTADSSDGVQVVDPPDPTGFLTAVAWVAASDNHSLAILSDGTLRSWGFKGYGQLGEGSSGILTAPARVVDPADPTGNLIGVAATSGGVSHTLALLGDDTVRAWGDNSDGQLGDGTHSLRWTPERVIDPTDPTGFLTGVSAVSVGWYHSAALLADSTVRTWGRNQFGGLGDGTSSNRPSAVAVLDLQDPTGFLSGVVSISAGSYHVVALIGDGTVRTWGRNISGELGDGTMSNRTSAVQVIDPTDPSGYLTRIVAVSAGGFHTIALRADGTVRTWGQNFYGQLGDGTATQSLTPVVVIDPVDPSGNLTGMAAIGGGTYHSVAAKVDGTVRAWGDNPGALGDGSTVDSPVPVQTVDSSDPSGFLTNIIAVDASWAHSIALRNDGTVRAWGWNSQGQLGDGTTTLRTSPVQVTDPNDATGFLTGVAAIAAGYYHTIAQK
ncbi:MAG: hypothetical protein O7H41_08480 [Planctomycetota bacterium]|nr:hypothetical protein [Planctomycetota bacterium]